MAIGSHSNGSLNSCRWLSHWFAHPFHPFHHLPIISSWLSNLFPCSPWVSPFHPAISPRVLRATWHPPGDLSAMCPAPRALQLRPRPRRCRPPSYVVLDAARLGGWTHIALWKMAMGIVDLPIKKRVFFMFFFHSNDITIQPHLWLLVGIDISWLFNWH